MANTTRALRSCRLQIPVTPEEQTQMKAAAKKSHLTLSSWIRMTCLAQIIDDGKKPRRGKAKK